jgi:hypothetical protein
VLARRESVQQNRGTLDNTGNKIRSVEGPGAGRGGPEGTAPRLPTVLEAYGSGYIVSSAMAL